MYCAAHTQLASAAALGRLSRASSPVSGGPWRPTALRRAPAAELRLPSSRSAANCVVAQPRGSTVAQRAARRCILAAVGAADDDNAADSSDGDAFAADEAEPVLGPHECALLLHKLYGKVLGLRSNLECQENAAREQLNPAQEYVEVCEAELKLCKLLRLRCERAGDAEGAKQYAGKLACKAKLLREAQGRVEQIIATGVHHVKVRDMTAQLEREERHYNMLREYTLERHGPEWADKAEKGGFLDVNELRRQARAWRASQAPQ